VVDAGRLRGALDLSSVASGLAKRRFSRTVSWKRYVSCETTPTSSANPRKLRSRTSTPPIVTLPRSTSYEPRAGRRASVLPEPVSPTSAVFGAGFDREETSRASTRPRSGTTRRRRRRRGTRVVKRVGFSAISTGSSRYSKIRSKSASDVCTSRPTPSSEPTGRKSAFCSVVNATSTGTEIAVEPCASASPPNQ
jgi:hypothetical protein